MQGKGKGSRWDRPFLSLKEEPPGERLARMLAVGVFFLIVPLFPLPAVHGAAQPPAEAEKPGYVGSEACRACHEEQFNKFARTKMGKLFMKGPRTDLERLSCEACHGPGEAHGAAGGGKGVGGMITFR